MVSRSMRCSRHILLSKPNTFLRENAECGKIIFARGESGPELMSQLATKNRLEKKDYWIGSSLWRGKYAYLKPAPYLRTISAKVIAEQLEHGALFGIDLE